MSWAEQSPPRDKLGLLLVDSFGDSFGGKPWLPRRMSFLSAYRKPLGKGASSCPFKCSRMKAAMTVNPAIL
jgi:hypothetical protein